jgi:RHS repeat-associated protein
VRQQFTGQERDDTGLDFFQARYFTSAQGRFASVDPGNAGASLGDPQSWNAYSYVSNSPLAYTDPSGLGFWSDLAGIIGDVVSDLFGGWLFGGFGGGGGGIVGGIAGSVNSSQPWNEQLPIGTGFGGALNTGGVFGSGDTGGFIFSLGDGDGNDGGFWTTDYNGAPYWYVPTSHTTSIGLQMRAAPKPSNLSIAGGCVVASVKDHLLGIGASAGASIATVPLKKPWLGIRDIGGPTNLLSKLGTYFNIRLSSPVAGGGANPQLGTLRAFGAAGRVLGPAAWAITGGQLLKAGQDAYSCYSSSH